LDGTGEPTEFGIDAFALDDRLRLFHFTAFADEPSIVFVKGRMSGMFAENPDEVGDYGLAAERLMSASGSQRSTIRSASSAQHSTIRSASSANEGRGLPNRTSGERDVSQPQVHDQTAPFFSNATNTFNSGEAEQ
jgi:hypothetical protein